MYRVCCLQQASNLLKVKYQKCPGCQASFRLGVIVCDALDEIIGERERDGLCDLLKSPPAASPPEIWMEVGGLLHVAETLIHRCDDPRLVFWLTCLGLIGS